MGQLRNIIIINAGTESKNISLNVTDAGFDETVDKLIQYDGDNKYNIDSGIAQLGILDSYGILYLTQETCTEGKVLDEDGLTCVWEVESGCSDTTMMGYKLVMLLSALGLVAFAVFTVYSGYKENNLTVGKLIVFSITLIVALVLWTASGQNLGASCGAVG